MARKKLAFWCESWRVGKTKFDLTLKNSNIPYLFIFKSVFSLVATATRENTAYGVHLVK